MLRLLVSTGEVSGDLQGSLLIKALHEEAQRRQLDLEIVALGGERMERAGAALLAQNQLHQQQPAAAAIGPGDRPASKSGAQKSFSVWAAQPAGSGRLEQEVRRWR